MVMTADSDGSLNLHFGSRRPLLLFLLPFGRGQRFLRLHIEGSMVKGRSAYI